MEWPVNEALAEAEHPGIQLPYLASVLPHGAQTEERVSPSESQEISPMEIGRHQQNSSKPHPWLEQEHQWREENPEAVKWMLLVEQRLLLGLTPSDPRSAPTSR